MSERPLPAVNLSRFAGLLGSEEERTSAEVSAPPAPRVAPVDAPVRWAMSHSAIISNVLDGAPIRPPATASFKVSVALDPKMVEQAVRESNMREWLRGALGPDLVEVRTTSSVHGKLSVTVVLRGRPEARRRPVYSSSDDGWEVDVPYVELDATEAVLSGDTASLRRLVAERVR